MKTFFPSYNKKMHNFGTYLLLKETLYSRRDKYEKKFSRIHSVGRKFGKIVPVINFICTFYSRERRRILKRGDQWKFKNYLLPMEN